MRTLPNKTLRPIGPRVSNQNGPPKNAARQKNSNRSLRITVTLSLLHGIILPTQFGRLPCTRLIARKICVNEVAKAPRVSSPRQENALAARGRFAGGVPQGDWRGSMFARGYIEVLFKTSDTPLAREFDAGLERHPGVHIVAFGVADAAAAHGRLAESGFRVRPLVEMHRAVDASNRTCPIKASGSPTGFNG
jgi:Glyoxalase-like domain